MKRIRLALAATVLVLLALHTLVKLRAGVLPEMLWACHVASLFVAIAAFADSPRLAAPGFLFHLGVGIPGLALDVLANGTTTWTSVALHVVTPVTAWSVLRGHALPRRALLQAWVFFLAMQLVSLATPAELNVNVAHQPWGFLPFEIGVWPSRAMNAAGALFFLAGAAALSRILLARAAGLPPRPALSA